MTALDLHYLFKDPISNNSHILKYWGLRLKHTVLGENCSVRDHPIRDGCLGGGGGGSRGSFPWTVLQVLSRPPGLKHLATLPRQLGFQDFTRPWEASRPGQLSKRKSLSAALTKLAMGIQS